MPPWLGRDRLALVLAVASPLAVAAMLPLRTRLENTQVAFILVVTGRAGWPRGRDVSP